MNHRLLASFALCLALAGCAGRRDPLRHALAQAAPTAPSQHLEARYVARCPDVLAIDIDGDPEASGPREIGPDGRIDGISTHVAGLSAPDIAVAIARELQIHESTVRVAVAEYRSQHLYLVGEIAAEHQLVPYRGPETVVDLLRRVGLDLKAEPAEVRVVRGHVADGKPPEVFHVDLRAVLMERDPRTNIRLEPSDHVHIGQCRASRVAQRMPPWLEPVCESLWGVR